MILTVHATHVFCLNIWQDKPDSTYKQYSELLDAIVIIFVFTLKSKSRNQNVSK